MQKSEAKKQEPKLTGKATITGVLSADSIVIKQTGGEDPIDGIVHLAWIQAPRIGSSQRVEEPFAFDARECIREKVIGKKCTFTQQYAINGRRYLSIEVDKQDISMLLVQAGLAKVQERRSGSDALHDALIAAQEEPKTKKTGVWSTEEAHIKKHLRQVLYFGEADYNPVKLLADSKAEQKPLAAILEHVFSASFVTLYVFKLQAVVKVNLLHLYTPKDADKDLIEQGKAFVDKMLLHKTVGLKLVNVDEQKNLVGRIYFSAGEIAAEVLKNGFCKLSTPKDSNFDAVYYKELKNAQIVGQTKRAGVWKDLKDTDLNQNKSKVSDFNGKVVEVHSGDSLTVEKESDNSHIRIYLSSIKAPAIGKVTKQGETPGEPYSWESKESLRKIAIGKKVRVEMEYSRAIQTKDGTDLTMNFGAVFLVQKEKNIACMQLEKGLVRTNIMKTGENASKYLEDVLASEKKAQDAKLCLHSSKQAPVKVFADLIGNTKLAKEYDAMISKRPDRKFQGVVEYCFSGMKYKVRLDDEGRSIAFSLLGIKTMSSDKNQPVFDEYANDALRFAKDHLFQRDVNVELFNTDKRGNFFGVLTMANKLDFATMLLEEGLAMVNLPSGSKQIVPNLDKMQTAEKNAQQKEIGIWGKSLKLMSMQQAETQFEPYAEIKVEVTHVTDASRFYVRVLDKAKVYKKIEDAMAKFDPKNAEELEKPIKKGTLCAAYSAGDKAWYRVRVVGTVGKGLIEVFFIDYGNHETLNSEGDLRKLPAHLLAYEPQAISASFAFIKCPRRTQQMGAEATKYVEKYALNTVHDACVVDQVGQELKLVMMEEGETDWSSSINAFILSEGLACLDKQQMADAPEECACFYEYEEEAKDKGKGLWKNGPVANLSDDEDY